MKINNKFIAIGLGLALAFTGTYFSYSWFTDNAILSHTINIGKLKNDISVDTARYAYFTNGHGNGFKNLYIPIKISGTIDKTDNIKIDVDVNGSLYNAKLYYGNSTQPEYIIITPNNNVFDHNVDVFMKITITINGEIGETKDYTVHKGDAGNTDCTDKTHPNHTDSGNNKCKEVPILAGNIPSFKGELEVPGTEIPKEETPELLPPSDDGENIPIQKPEVDQKPEQGVDKPQVPEEKPEEKPEPEIPKPEEKPEPAPEVPQEPISKPEGEATTLPLEVN